MKENKVRKIRSRESVVGGKSFRVLHLRALMFILSETGSLRVLSKGMTSDLFI